jgi:fatty-acyl-CoA synthase
MPVALLERYADRGIVIRQGMGLTETSPTLFLTDEAHALSKAGSVGKPVLHTEIRVVAEDGYVYIVDRWKDMFISGGENVYPAEVEQVLFRHPAVLDVAVIGVPDERWDEVGLAVVVPRDPATFSGAKLLAFCADKLAKYKIPKSVRTIDELPRNAAGKVLKRELREWAGVD